ncbi:oxygen tolerance protein BatD [Gillisia mitskevichiae]|uniref:Oxygen tolerance protein BatD n=1 Tax=Gillisia mitskevichiae TaxID=270921 RepID=A0A495PXB1_9FLAO|nr:BatD family protein [Gillisia mitskevichiae]RKS55468.1 oxygen tolerance protein BatD [Gillisia mitskevichiae]
MKLGIIILSFFLAISTISVAQVKFEAKASKNKLGVNERLRVDFEMNKDGDNFIPPSFKGFTVVGGPNQAVSNSWINGKRTYSKTYSYFLAPTSRGRVTISQAEITIDGEIYKTTPIQVEVTSAVETPTDGNNSDFVASENLHLVAEISNSNPFLNEAITVVYKLYVSPLVSVSNWREMDSPVYSDFWSQNIDIKQLKIESGTYEGEPYRFVVLRKTILYPQKTGELEIQPLALSVSVDVPSERRDIFGGRLYTTVDKTVTAGKRNINVKSLPLVNKPANFTGAVGNFDFKVNASKTKLAATESLTFKVQVSGKGNLKLFDLPKLEVPSSIELYEPERIENVRTDLNGTQGSIADTYTVVPNQKGNFPIPALSFSYFDLSSKSYKTINAEEIMLDVSGAPANSSFSAGNNVNKLPVEGTGKQFEYIKLSTNLKPINSGPFLGSVLFWTFLSLPIAVVFLGIILGKKRRKMVNDVQGNKIKKANRLAKKYLSEAKNNLGDQKSFYIALERALHNYLKAKLHLQTNEMSKDKIDVLLQERKVDAATSKEFISLIESCEFARYAPSSSVTMNQDYEKAATTISALDKQL